MLWFILIIFMVLGWIVQYRLKSKIHRYASIPMRAGISGAEAAQAMLRDYSIYDIRITCIPGQLTDHYNPADRSINLSEHSYHGTDAAAIAVATHETGHAVQHAQQYSMLSLRSTLVPITNLSSKVLNIIFIFGFIGAGILQIFPYQLVLLIIVVCYAMLALFSIITLPVEFDASKRALSWISASGVATSQEYAMSKDALRWAAMTYVVAALSSISMLLYYLIAMFGRRD